VVREAKPHRSIYVPPPGFGKTGMSRNRLDDLTKCLRLCERPEMRPPGMSSEKYDSYSASVATAQELKRCRLRSIGVVKTVTKRCPLAYLSALKLHDCGDRQRPVTRDADGQPTLLSFVWMDRNRRYFIASGPSLQEGVASNRERWRQVDDALLESIHLFVK
jgi:hypothetical protein